MENFNSKSYSEINNTKTFNSSTFFYDEVSYWQPIGWIFKIEFSLRLSISQCLSTVHLLIMNFSYFVRFRVPLGNTIQNRWSHVIYYMVNLDAFSKKFISVWTRPIHSQTHKSPNDLKSLCYVCQFVSDLVKYIHQLVPLNRCFILIIDCKEFNL